MDSLNSKSFADAVVKVLNGMAQGLFASLIIGLIIKQIGTYAGLDILVSIGQIAQYMTGPAIGIGVANAVNAPPLARYSSCVTGAVGAGTLTLSTYALSTGEPLGATVAALVGALCGRWISGRTKVDIILVPVFTILSGSIVGIFLSPVVAALMNAINIGGNAILIFIYDLFQLFSNPASSRLQSGQVYRYRAQIDPPLSGLADIPADISQHFLVKHCHQTEMFKERHKYSRLHPSSILPLPADQRLRSAVFPRSHIQLGLIPDMKFPVFYCHLKFLLHSP